ncbi:hypothetical protein IFM89_007609 [Coptis chinensis]|uniref:Uncharacterized protein n=1 Tax=Coptis chinensis TaxID=261450 RepID=A0A835GZS6_9MAGN|nr:hypothetical protein IFM89_007609 [Coptis chinensis]
MWINVEKTLSSHNNKGRSAIFMTMNHNEFRRISACTTSKEAWDKLVMAHEGNSAVKENVINSSTSLGLEYPNVKVGRKILRSLPKRFRSRKDTIQEAHDIKTMTIETLAGKLRTFEMELEFENPHKGQFHNQGSRPHDRFKRENKPDKSFTDLSKVQYYKCDRFGHDAHNFPKKLNKEKRKANISVTWDDSDDETELDDSQADENVNYVVFAASLGGDFEESDKDSFVHGKLNHFESSVTDDDWAEMYSNYVAKCIKLDKTNKNLIVKLDALSAQVLSRAEEYNIQAELFEQEKKTFLSKIDFLKRENFDSEEKCKSVLAVLEHTKKDLVFTQQQLKAFSNGA